LLKIVIGKNIFAGNVIWSCGDGEKTCGDGEKTAVMEQQSMWRCDRDGWRLTCCGVEWEQDCLPATCFSL